MASADLDASVAERLGGRWAISWQGFAITAPMGVVVIALSAQASSNVGTWFLVAVLVVLLGAAWTYLLHRTVFRDRGVKPVSMRWVVAAAVIGGALYAGTAAAFGLVLQLLDPGSIAAQFIPLFVVVVAWGMLLTLILDSQWRYRVQREELVQQAVQRQLASAQELDVLRDVRESIRLEVDGHVKASSAALIQRIDALIDAGESDAGELALDLRQTAASTVRPLSHELEDRARASHRTPGIWVGLANIVRYQPFRPVAVSIVYLITGTPREVNLHGWMIGLGLLVVTVAFIFAIMLPLNQAMERWPERHVLIYLVGLVLIQAPTVLLTPLREQVTGESFLAADLVVTTFFGTFVVLATSSFGSWNRTRKEVIVHFQREGDADTIATLARGEALARATMDAALVLHGSVQSSLYACAMAIEEASRRKDMVAVNQALMQARAILEQPDLEPSARESMSLAEAVAAPITQWSGLLAVTVAIDPEAEARATGLTRHLADLVEEAIANAVHHGSASQVSVRIGASDHELVITVQDNGSGPGAGSPGLGSRLFSRFGGRLELAERADGAQGSVVTICLPISQSARPVSR